MIKIRAFLSYSPLSKLRLITKRISPIPQLLEHFHLKNPSKAFNSVRYQYSSFKDQFNNQQMTGILKEFEHEITGFQKSYDQELFKDAYQHLQKAAQLMKKVNCHISTQYVEIMLNMAVTSKKLNQTQKVFSAFKNAEEILDILPEQNYTYKQIVYSNLSIQYETKKDTSNTILYLDKLLKIYQKTNIESFEVVAINEKIGSLYLDQSKENQSVPFFKKALELIDRLSGQNSKDSQKILDDLSYVYYKLAKFEAALQTRLKILQIQQRHSGKDNLAYISHLKNVGMIYKRLNNFAKYCQYLEQSLNISSKIGQLQHPIVLKIKQSLAISYLTVQQFEKALPLLQSILKNTSPSQQDKHLYFKKAIAECYKNMHDYSKSLLSYQQILQVLNRKEEKTCELAYVLSEIGLMNYNLEKYQDSLALYLKSLQIQESIHGKQSQACIRIYQNVAQLYYLLGENQKSQEYLKRVDLYKMTATKSNH